MTDQPTGRRRFLPRPRGLVERAVAHEAAAVQALVHRGEEAGERLAGRDPFWPGNGER